MRWEMGDGRWEMDDEIGEVSIDNLVDDKLL
jgi:hypothetical protein